ncbi:MAG: DUF4298 domain-containing protein [Clostridia bacterium]|nr:DUF4298 domain-containing protein [Clostridia bacterium]
MTELERINSMELRLDQTNAAITDLNAQLERLEKMKAQVTELFQYYGSESWYKDREISLPEGVKAGVLSEDLPYDAVTDLRDAAFRMLELGTDILKNWL